jgi:hypothetical protein
MKVVILSFTLKGQSIEDVITTLKQIAAEEDVENLYVYSGHMSPKDAKNLGYSPQLGEVLKELFPNYTSFYVEGAGTQRKMMVDLASRFEARAIVIGEYRGTNVEEEIELCRNAGIEIEFLPIFSPE